MSLCINPGCSELNNYRDMLFCQACGSELLLQGRYRVKSKLGGGGFGETYELTDNTGQAKVLKVLIDNRPKAVELFQREAEVLKILNHPGIPKVEKDGYFLYFPRNSQKHLHCLVMEKIEGLNLSKYINQQRNQPIDQELAIKWLRELTLILQEVHKQNFFHRDIKPSNIMLRNDGRLALIDFGTVRQVTKTYVTKQAAGDVTGIVSSGYTPIEQINGQAVQQSDFFALGRTFIYLLTGQTPSQLYNPCTNILEWRDMVPAISPHFADILDEMMANSAFERPQNTQIILQKLQELDTNSPSLTKIKLLRKKVVYKAPKVINSQTVNSQPITTIKYASIWKRFWAYFIDFIILSFMAIIISIAIELSLKYFISFPGLAIKVDDITSSVLIGSFGVFPGILEILDPEPESAKSNIIFIVFGMIIHWLYFTLFESSKQQATPGKQVLDIHVTDLNQEKISFFRANIRYWSKLISVLLLMAGFFICIFTQKKQNLHDMIACTTIIKKYD